ncbi:Dipeptide transport system permease protein DppB [Thalassoglobus neptunius]|uniref:Dipeptide transport system permease protein DppB n=1 Tax=Thalassoglobus neptunius TaxID=1938619 RepID=A0A5C5X4Q0_9PLAN|nr:ABC transporter permease [Thalassoglobus neptunius]TWT57559.1 Dipeptide transport system permease protein DppB [Thalassoglobus neptunius]
MISFLVRRIAIGVVTLMLITFIIFGLIRNMPGTPITMDLQDPEVQFSKERIAQLEAAYGLDKPWPLAYVHWLGNAVQGDLGRSYKQKIGVTRVIFDRLGPTLLLSVPSLFLAFLLSIPLGIYAGANAGSRNERILSTILYMLYSLPSFVAALFLQLWLAVYWEWFPLEGIQSNTHNSMSSTQQVFDYLWHAFLPVICLTYGSLAYDSRFVRANLQEVLRQDYIRTAKAKGLSPRRVMWQHAFRNTLIPFVTLVGLTLPSLVSGSVIIEGIFSWPGMGLELLQSITERDYPVVMGITLVYSVMTLISQLLADVFYAVVDPRVRLDNN